MTQQHTIAEMFGSLTGTEEEIIARHFGEVTSIMQEKPTMWARSLVMIDKLRGGLEANKAKKAAMELTMREVDNYFAQDEDEPSPEDPVTDQGKEGSASS